MSEYRILKNNDGTFIPQFHKKDIPIEKGIYENWNGRGTLVWAKQNLYIFMSSLFKHQKAIRISEARTTRQFIYYNLLQP
jgi:hypothetical protein